MMSEFTRALEPLLSLQKSLERARTKDYLGSHFADFFGVTPFGRNVFPPVTVWKDKDELLVSVEIPGIRKEDINIEVKNDLLRLHGVRRLDYDVNEVSIHRRERSDGNFDRTLKLPFPVEADKAKAAFESGVLKISLPLSEGAKPKRINIG